MSSRPGSSRKPPPESRSSARILPAALLVKVFKTLGRVAKKYWEDKINSPAQPSTLSEPEAMIGTERIGK
jgi:hypothetical protein